MKWSFFKRKQTIKQNPVEQNPVEQNPAEEDEQKQSGETLLTKAKRLSDDWNSLIKISPYGSQHFSYVIPLERTEESDDEIRTFGIKFRQALLGLKTDEIPISLVKEFMRTLSTIYVAQAVRDTSNRGKQHIFPKFYIKKFADKNGDFRQIDFLHETIGLIKEGEAFVSPTDIYDEEVESLWGSIETAFSNILSRSLTKIEASKMPEAIHMNVYERIIFSFFYVSMELRTTARMQATQALCDQNGISQIDAIHEKFLDAALGIYKSRFLFVETESISLAVNPLFPVLPLGSTPDFYDPQNTIGYMPLAPHVAWYIITKKTAKPYFLYRVKHRLPKTHNSFGISEQWMLHEWEILMGCFPNKHSDIIVPKVKDGPLEPTTSRMLQRLLEYSMGDAFLMAASTSNPAGSCLVINPDFPNHYQEFTFFKNKETKGRTVRRVKSKVKNFKPKKRFPVLKVNPAPLTREQLVDAVKNMEQYWAEKP